MEEPQQEVRRPVVQQRVVQLLEERPQVVPVRLEQLPVVPAHPES